MEWNPLSMCVVCVSGVIKPMKEGCLKSPGALPVVMMQFSKLRVGCKQTIVCIRNSIEAPYVGIEVPANDDV
eukprot:1139534-Pelagomonas_calceolata.AAC.1